MRKLNIQCCTCIHNEVCKLSAEYKAAIKALEEVNYFFGKNSVASIRETVWLDVVLKCIHSKDISGGTTNET